MGFVVCLPSQFEKAETCCDDHRRYPARTSHNREFATRARLRLSPEQRVVKRPRIQKTQQSQNHQRPCHKHPPPWVPLNKIGIAHSFESQSAVLTMLNALTSATSIMRSTVNRC